MLSELVPRLVGHAAHPLDDLEEEGGAITHLHNNKANERGALALASALAHRLGEDLQQHAAVVGVGEDAEASALLDLLLAQRARAELGVEVVEILPTWPTRQWIWALQTTACMGEGAFL